MCQILLILKNLCLEEYVLSRVLVESLMCWCKPNYDASKSVFLPAYVVLPLNYRLVDLALLFPIVR